MIEQVHEILNALKRPATLKDIAGQAQLSAEDAANALQSLIQDGYCVETKGKGNRKFAPIRMMHLIRAAPPPSPARPRLPARWMAGAICIWICPMKSRWTAT